MVTCSTTNNDKSYKSIYRSYYSFVYSIHILAMAMHRLDHNYINVRNITKATRWLHIRAIMYNYNTNLHTLASTIQ